MANNRLYIGNKDTGKCICISKSGDEWGTLRPDDIWMLNEMIESDCSWNEKTNLIFFTETDDKMFNFFFLDKPKNLTHEQWEEVKPILYKIRSRWDSSMWTELEDVSEDAVHFLQYVLSNDVWDFEYDELMFEIDDLIEALFKIGIDIEL